MQKMAVPTFW